MEFGDWMSLKVSRIKLFMFEYWVISNPSCFLC